jgi:hypothetical protein
LDMVFRFVLQLTRKHRRIDKVRRTLDNLSAVTFTT